MSGGIYNSPDGQQLHGDGKPVFNPALEQICASEEHAELIREKALHYMAIAQEQIYGAAVEDLSELVPKVMFTLFACGFGEGVRAERTSKN